MNVFLNSLNFLPNQINNPFFFNNQNMIGMNNNMNNFNNQIFMINQMQMMQMNQMMMKNMLNQNNAINFINKNQKMLVDKIIDFYKKK